VAWGVKEVSEQRLKFVILHLAEDGARGDEYLYYTGIEAHLAARASSHDGDAPSAIRSRYHRDRPLARA